MEMFTSENYFDKIDLQKEADYLIDNNSIKALLVYNDIDTRCRCFEQIHNSGSSNCTICGGDGYEKICKVVDAFIDSDTRITKAGVEFKEMQRAFMQNVIYTKSSVNIPVDSYILVVGYIDGLPCTVIEVYNCQSVSDTRATRGQRVYNRVLGFLSPQMVQRQDRLIKRMPNKEKSKLMNGGVYKWRL